MALTQEIFPQVPRTETYLMRTLYQQLSMSFLDIFNKIVSVKNTFYTFKVF